MAREIYEPRRKALQINLDSNIYGTFAEIGGGQEVARNFFSAGAASGTVAKTISAYDMAFSDSIYGEEESGRYVSETRVGKMIEYEYKLLAERLQGEKYENKTFFAFANTVATINFAKTNDPHGWMGIRFQKEINAPTNDIIVHVRLLDTDSQLQQKVLGILGVNLIYAAFFYSDNAQTMIDSLMDNLSMSSIEIDMAKVSGPLFKDVNERFLNLYLNAKGYAKAALFKPDTSAIQVKDHLYRKNIVILRTKYRQKSLPHFDMLNQAVEQFYQDTGATPENTVVIIEILMGNLLDENPDVSNEDLQYFAERAELLCATGNNILVSNFRRNNHLAEFLNQFNSPNIGIVTNVSNLKAIFNSDKYNKEAYTHELLAYISGMFSKNIKLYAYPYLRRKENKTITIHNMGISVEAKPLFDFLIQNKYIVGIENYEPKHVKGL